MGSAVVLVVLAIHFPYLHYIGGPHYVYYLNGVEIANSHGVPAQTLEYGQYWPPATDKIFLDAFTGVLVLFGQNPLIGPGVLLLLSVLGAGLGLWASAWELGLRYTGSLLPLLLLANGVLFDTKFSDSFTEYRAEDFGRAVAFCALALGIVAIRERSWRTAVVAGVVLAAASGSHLIPALVVVLALACIGLARLLCDAGWQARIATLRSGLVIGCTGAALGVLIRVFAGGSFGLGGASNQIGLQRHPHLVRPDRLSLSGYLPAAGSVVRTDCIRTYQRAGWWTTSSTRGSATILPRWQVATGVGGCACGVRRAVLPGPDRPAYRGPGRPRRPRRDHRDLAPVRLPLSHLHRRDIRAAEAGTLLVGWVSSWWSSPSWKGWCNSWGASRCRHWWPAQPCRSSS